MDISFFFQSDKLGMVVGHLEILVSREDTVSSYSPISFSPPPQQARLVQKENDHSSGQLPKLSLLLSHGKHHFLCTKEGWEDIEERPA